MCRIVHAVRVRSFLGGPGREQDEASTSVGIALARTHRVGAGLRDATSGRGAAVDDGCAAEAGWSLGAEGVVGAGFSRSAMSPGLPRYLSQ
jgi:hypothetical protein